MRQPLDDLDCPLRWRPRQYVLHIFVRIRLISPAARLPLRNDPAKSQLLCPSANGLIWLLGTGVGVAGQVKGILL